VEQKRSFKVSELAPKVISEIEALNQTYGEFAQHESLQVSNETMASVLSELTDRLQDNFPYFHPNYAAQMLKPPHPVAVAAYLATMMINPNNHSIDASKATTQMEREVLRQIADMFDYPQEFLGHLTWSGTTANLEALWIGREINPGKAIAHSADSHYTHSRMAEVLNIESISIATDDLGKMDLNALQDALKTGKIGTVVATLGTTGLGAVDPLADILPLARKYGARVHVDTAYGGFFKIIAANHLSAETARHFAEIKHADSVVVDPHKHGLQPYGCGAVFFNDITIGRFYKHDSPYTYFTSDEMHFGEIQLECSRAGASAAALWATLKIFPLTEQGLGAALIPCHRAAINWHEKLSESDLLAPYQMPELDIIAYLPKSKTMAELDFRSHELLVRAAEGERANQVHLATYVVKAQALEARGLSHGQDLDSARIMRSVLMKPESEAQVPFLHSRIEELLVSL